MCWRKHLPILKCQCNEKAQTVAERETVRRRLESVRLYIDDLERESRPQRDGQPPPAVAQ